MRRATAILGSAIFLVIAPGTVAMWVPWTISHWWMQPPLFGLAPLRWLGVVLIALGLPVLLDSFLRFAVKGLGTPAPVAPSRLLPRHRRPPMVVTAPTCGTGAGGTDAGGV